VTRDYDGDGYLDAMELRFSKQVTMLDYPYATVQIVYSGLQFEIDSIYGPVNRYDSVFVLALKEIDNKQPQTAWRPSVTLVNAPSGSYAPQYIAEATDGAGPVIWKIVKIINNVDKRDMDLVKVTFSEPVYDTTMNTLSPATPPDLVFNVFYQLGDTMILVDTMLIGIPSFHSTSDLTTFEFYMLNGKDLHSLYFMNLRTDEGAALVADANGNKAVVDNKKTRVVVGEAYGRMISVPSPAKVSSTGPEFINLVHNKYARQNILNSGEGIILTFKLVLPDSTNIRIIGKLKIYDVAGNLVQSAETYGGNETGSIIPADLQAEWPGAAWDIDIEWSGKNARGMKVSPGIYRAVLFLEYKHGATTSMSRKFRATIPIAN
jgi:hypothetical protein